MAQPNYYDDLLKRYNGPAGSGAAAPPTGAPSAGGIGARAAGAARAAPGFIRRLLGGVGVGAGRIGALGAASGAVGAVGESAYDAIKGRENPIDANIGNRLDASGVVPKGVRYSDLVPRGVREVVSMLPGVGLIGQGMKVLDPDLNQAASSGLRALGRTVQGASAGLINPLSSFANEGAAAAPGVPNVLDPTKGTGTTGGPSDPNTPLQEGTAVTKETSGPSVSPDARMKALGADPMMPGLVDQGMYTAAPRGGGKYDVVDVAGNTGTFGRENAGKALGGGNMTIVPAGQLPISGGGIRRSIGGGMVTETPNTAARDAGYERVTGLDGVTRTVKMRSQENAGGGLGGLLGGGGGAETAAGPSVGFGGSVYDEGFAKARAEGDAGRLDRGIRRMLDSGLSPGRKADMLTNLKAIGQRSQEAALDRDTALQVAGIRGGRGGAGAGGPDFGDLLNYAKFQRDIQRDSVTDERNARIDARDEAKFGVDAANTARTDQRAANETLGKSLDTIYPLSGGTESENTANRARRDRVMGLIANDERFAGKNLDSTQVAQIAKMVELSDRLNTLAKNQSGLGPLFETEQPNRRSLRDIEGDFAKMKKGAGYRDRQVDLKSPWIPFRDELNDNESELYADLISRLKVE